MLLRLNCGQVTTSGNLIKVRVRVRVRVWVRVRVRVRVRVSKVGALVKKAPLCKVGILSMRFFFSCHSIKPKINGLNRLKAKNDR